MKEISLLLLTIVFTTRIFGQHLSAGLQFGLNISNLGGNNIYDMNSNPGFYSGLLLSMQSEHRFALQSGIIYSRQGSKYVTGDGSKHTLFLHCVNLPLRFQYKINENVYLQTGTQVEFLVKVKDKVGGNETGFFTSQDFKTVNLSLSAGFAYSGNSGWGFDSRYNFGINNISNGGIYTFKNNVFQLGLFYMFNNNHKAVSARRGY